MDSPATIFMLSGILLLAVVGVIYLLVGMRAKPRLDTAKYQAKWLQIENSIDHKNPATWQLAVLNADKLLDHALRESHYKGTTMGERMKAADTTWSNANHVWSAHKIRNQLAHETNAKLTFETTARALGAFKRGLKDLGAI